MEELLTNLLAVPSVSSDRDANNRALEVIAEYFVAAPAHIVTVEKNGVRSLIISTDESKKQFRIMLNGHVDVVPAADEMFVPKREGAKLHGRGASDMKGTVAALAAAYKRLLLAGKADDVALVLTSDEEIGGLNGTNYVVNELGYFAPTVFLPDPGRGDWSICTDEKGGIWYHVVASGKAAHASRPWQGENAVAKLTNAHTEIRAAFDHHFGLATEENNWIPTVNLAAINGGQAYNSVPDNAEMKLDCRFPAEVSLSQIRDIIEPILNKFGLSFTNPIVIPAAHTNPDAAAVQSWQQLVLEHKGFTPTFYKTHGSSDARFFSAKGMDVIMTKSLASEIHGDVEWIDVEDLEVFQRVLYEWLSQPK